MSLCLKPCSSVSHKSPTPLAGGEAVPRKRENQINTLVLKDINFTINIIELSYYRTIDTLNQSKMLPWYKTRKPPKRKPPQAPPKEGMSLTLLTYFHRFKLYPIRTSPPSEGLGEAVFTQPLVHSLLYSPFLLARGRGLLLSSSQDYPHPPATPLTPCAPDSSMSMSTSEL